MDRFSFWIGTFLLAISVVLSSGASAQQQPDTTANRLSISADELILFNFVNDLRQKNKLPVIPLSGSLCTVAKTHINDLLTWNPQGNECGLLSWSEHGPWKPVCYNKDPMGSKYMSTKPSEITGYTGQGFELVYLDEKQALPGDAYDLWKQVDASNELILCKGKWQNRNWKAMGVAIRQGLALLWVGDKPDELFDICYAGTDSLVQAKTVKARAPVTTQPKATEARAEVPKKKPVQETVAVEKPVKGKFYVIVAGSKDEKQANEKLNELKQKGYTDAIILHSAERIRISIGIYDSETKAKERMKELKPKFPDCWLFRQ